MFVYAVMVGTVLGNLIDEERHLLPAEKDEGASDDGSEDAGEDEEEDDEAVLRLAVHPWDPFLVPLSRMSLVSICNNLNLEFITKMPYNPSIK